MMEVRRQPLLMAQSAIYVHGSENQDSTQYNLPMCYIFPLEVPNQTLTEAVHRLIAVHPALKAGFQLDDQGQVMQYIREEDGEPEITTLSWSEEEYAQRKMELVRPFKIMKERLSRFIIIETEQYRRLFVDIHHTVFDGFSSMIFKEDLYALVAGHDVYPEKLSLLTSVMLEREQCTPEACETDLKWYEEHLAGIPSTTFPQKTNVARSHKTIVSMNIPNQTIDDFCSQLDVTPNVFFTSVLALSLSRCTHENKVSFCVVNHGRRSRDQERTIGCFVRALPAGFEMRPGQTVSDFLLANKAMLRELWRHQSASLSDIFKRTGQRFEIGMTYTKWSFLDGPGNDSEYMEAEDIIDRLSLAIFHKGDSYELRIGYDDGCFRQSDMQTLFRTIATCISQMIANPEAPCDSLSLVSDEDRAKLLAFGKGPENDYDENMMFLDYFRRNVERFPDKAAVVAPNGSFTYRELDELSDRLAAKLRAAGVTPGCFAAVMVPRVREFMLAVIASFKTGCAYVPLDADYPNERLEYMLEDSEAKVLITFRPLIEQKRQQGGFKAANIVFLDGVETFPLPTSQERQAFRLDPDSLAYMIYTSGSTGKPKGVMIRQRSLMAYLSWMRKQSEVTDDDAIMCTSSFSFDASVDDLFNPLAAGGTLHIISASLRSNLFELNQYIIANRISGGTFSTQLGMEMYNLYTPPLRYAFMGGEKMLPVKKCDSMIINGYGPTEFTVCSSYHVVDQAKDVESIPIGKPVPGSCSYVLDANGQLTPYGLPGELCIAGVQTAAGYWKRDELTREKFVSNPYSDSPDTSVYYHTGDLVRWNEEGELEYLGRLDHQVKLRGFRIELEEIESVLALFPGLTGSVVAIRKLGNTDHLCAYYTSDEKVNHDEMIRFLSERLTEYMVPDIWTRLDKMPMTPGGKIDRRNLPEPSGITEHEYIAPRDEKEEALASVFSLVLQEEKIGIDDSFFILGGDSIKAIRATSLLRNRGYQLAVYNIMKGKTIREIAAFMTKVDDESEDASGKDNASFSQKTESDADNLPWSGEEYRAVVSQFNDANLEIERIYPLTPIQEGMLIHRVSFPDSPVYQLQSWYEVDADLTKDQLVRAVRLLFDKHEALRTSIVYREVSTPQQVLPKTREPEVAWHDFSQLDNPAAAMAKLEKDDADRLFDLQIDPLLRIAAVHLGNRRTRLLVSYHHIVVDGWCISIFIEDLRRFLSDIVAGKEIAPVCVEPQCHYETAVRAILARHTDQTALYWKELLAGYDSVAEIPSPKQSGSAYFQINHVRSLGAGTFRRAARLSAKLDITVPTLLEGVYGLLLQKCASLTDVVFGKIVTGRNLDVPGVERMVGLFINTIPVRVKAEKDDTVASLLARLQKQAIESNRFDAAPLSEIQRLSEQGNNLIKTAFAYVDFHNEPEKTRPGQLKMELLKISAETDFDFSFQCGKDDSSELCINIHANGARYTPAAVETIANAFTNILNAFIECENGKTDDISLVSTIEKNELLALGKGPENEYDDTMMFLDHFRRNVERFPDKTAVVASNGSFTYRELDELSDRLAVKLRAAGVYQNSFAAVMFPRVREFMLAVVAIFKAGGAYVPLDADYPNERLTYMLQDSAAKVLVTFKSLFEQKCLEGEFKADSIVFVDELETFPVPALQERQTFRADPDSLAYMIYTSGSTGRPKGVMIRHRSLMAYLSWNMKLFNITGDDAIACTASFSFDATIDDLFDPLVAGGTLHILSASLRTDLYELNQYIISNRIAGGSFSTQLGMALLNLYTPPLRYMFIGGEKLQPVKKCDTMIVNGYGPTEFTVNSNYHIVDQAKDTEIIPIGKPVPGSCSYVLDTHGQLMPRGLPGELCIAGIQTAKGYWNRDDLTRERFLANPYSDSPDTSVYYRTGDLVRWNEEGELEYLGRLDHQVKLRGFRIELEEIESVLAHFPGLNVSVVAIKKLGDVDHLCAYYTSDKEIDQNEMIRFLSERLTEYMVPDIWTRLDKMPMTPGGKVDRRNLPAPAFTATEIVAPRNASEQLLFDMVKHILGHDAFGVTTNLFSAGMTSMSAIKFAAVLQKERERFTVNASYADIFKYQTIEKLASFLHGELINTARPAPEKDLAGYDYSGIEQVLAKNTIQPGFKPDSVVCEPYGNILVTGGTGYLGIHVIHTFLTKYTGAVYCLIRGSKKEIPIQRLRKLLFYYFDDDFAELVDKRLFVVEGDITDMESLGKLDVPISTVINCAAYVKHFTEGDEIYRVNWHGVENLVKWCMQNGKKLIQVSTVSVGGSSVGNNPPRETPFTEHDLWLGQTMESKYLDSKFLAERAILDAVAKDGLRGKILRAGNLMPRSSDGEFQINFNANSFMKRLKAFKLLGMCPVSMLAVPVELSPIDETAEILLTLGAAPDDYTVFHLYNNHRISFGDVMFSMNDYGFPIRIVTDEEYTRALNEAIEDEKRVTHFSGILAYQKNDTTLQSFPLTPVSYFTETIQYCMRSTWGQSTQAYIQNMIAKLDGFGFFDDI